MKKIILSFLIVLALIAGIDNVKAACAIFITVDGEMLCEGQSNADNTAYVKDGKVYLDNYNGGPILVSGNPGPSFGPIYLIGNNTITNPDGYGILTGGNIFDKLSFAGDGMLTIDAKYPIVNDYYFNESEEGKTEECPKCNNETPAEESNSLLENKYVSITALSLDVIFLFLVVALVSKK